MRRRDTILAAAVLFGLSAVPTLAQQPAPRPAGPPAVSDAPKLVYFGTRATGAGQGVMGARFDPKTGALSSLGLAAEIERPTWVMPSPHRPVLYSVSETGNDGKSNASVYSFSADPATGVLTQMSKVDAGGGGATHLVLNGKQPSLAVANYGSGSISIVPLQPGGKLSPVSSVQTHTGSGPLARQASPHAHGVVVDKSGRFILASDLGADRVFVHRFDLETLKLSPGDPAFVAAKPGSGPRHVILHPNGRFAYVNSDFTGEITSYAWDGEAGRLKPLKTVQGFATPAAPGKEGGEIAFSPDGRFLYASNRGEDTLVVYAVDPDSGDLRETQRLASGGKMPWAFAFDASARWLLVALEASDQVVVFARDPASGKLTPTQNKLAVPHPTSIAILIG